MQKIIFLFLLLAGISCSAKKPTCSYDESMFIGGLDGFCEETRPDQFHLVFKDHSGKKILEFDWPGDLKNEPPTNCQEMCEVGAMQVAYGTNRLNPNFGKGKDHEQPKKTQGYPQK